MVKNTARTAEGTNATVSTSIQCHTNKILLMIEFKIKIIVYSILERGLESLLYNVA